MYGVWGGPVIKHLNICDNTQEIYKDQEPPYLMRQICVQQWEEIKTKNSGATHHFLGKRAQGVE